MTTHLGVMVLYAALISTVFGVLLRDDPREQWRFGGRAFLWLVGGAYLAGWLMLLVFD